MNRFQDISVQSWAGTEYDDVIADDTLTPEQRADERERRIVARRAIEEEQQRLRYQRQRRFDYEATGYSARALGMVINGEIDETSPIVEKLSSWDCKARSIFIASGPTGIGKTFAATAWAWRQRVQPFFMRAATFATVSRYDEDRRNLYLKAEALVIDDLGAEYVDAKGSFNVDLDELIDRYYASRNPLVITTNLTVDDFKRRYGERIADRLREAGTWQSFTGKSRRGAND